MDIVKSSFFSILFIMGFFPGFFSLPSWGVDISTKIYLPQVEGLNHSEIKSEINGQSSSQVIRFSMEQEKIADLLKRLNLSPLNESSSESRQIAQCEEKVMKRKAAFRLITTDRDWLKEQSWWCRTTRRINHDFCRPSSKNDIVNVASIQALEPQSEEVLKQSVRDTGFSCESSLFDDSGKQLIKLNECLVNPSDLKECKSYFSQNLSPESNRHLYMIDLSLESTQTVRSEIAPRTMVIMSQKTLDTLSVSNITLERLYQWGQSFTLPTLLSQFQSRVVSPLTIRAQYTIQKEGKTLNEIQTAQVSSGQQEVNIYNYPSQVNILRKDILSLEEYSDTSADRNMVISLQNMCDDNRNHRDETYLTPFGAFVCLEKGADIDVFGKRTQMRLKFKDQLGIERYLTWERKAPIDSCQFEPNPMQPNIMTLTCQMRGDDRQAWEAWVRDDSSLLKSLFYEPTFGNETYVHFRSLESFIPQAQDRAPLRAFVVPQAHEFSIFNLASGQPLFVPLSFGLHSSEKLNSVRTH